jgi:murein L,D-transpeptidase YcbB/YkuD
MALTPQQLNADERRDAIRSEDLNWRTTTRNEDLTWRQGTREEDVNWRTATRNEDLAWRQVTREEDVEWRTSTRTEDLAWRQQQLQVQSQEAHRANRRYALLAAAQSLKPGTKSKDVFELAAQFAAWIESPDRTGGV